MVNLYSLKDLENIYNPIGCYLLVDGNVYQIKLEICKSHAEQIRREQIIDNTGSQYILELRGTSYYLCYKVLNI